MEPFFKSYILKLFLLFLLHNTTTKPVEVTALLVAEELVVLTRLSISLVANWRREAIFTLESREVLDEDEQPQPDDRGTIPPELVELIGECLGDYDVEERPIQRTTTFFYSPLTFQTIDRTTNPSISTRTLYNHTHTHSFRGDVVSKRFW